MKKYVNKIFKGYLILYPVVVCIVCLYFAITGYTSYSTTYYGFSAIGEAISNFYMDHLLFAAMSLTIWLMSVIYMIMTKVQLKTPKKILFYLSIIIWILYLLGGVYAYFNGFNFLFTRSIGFEGMLNYYFIIGIVLCVLPVLPIAFIVIILYIIQKLKAPKE